MFFFLSKVLDTLFSPYSWALILLVVAIARRKNQDRITRRATIAAFTILFVFSEEIVANGLWRYLETPSTRTVRDDVTYDAVLLLGGMIDDRATEDFTQTAYDESVERLLASYDLLRHDRARVVIISAGPIEYHSSKVFEAQVISEQLIAWGIDPSRIIVEPTARNTRDNAVEFARIAREHGWTRLVAVTSAFHMPRSLACFRAVGLEVDALPVDYRSYDASRHPVSWLPRSGFLTMSVAALRELAGGVIYRARGYAK